MLHWIQIKTSFLPRAWRNCGVVFISHPLKCKIQAQFLFMGSLFPHYKAHVGREQQHNIPCNLVWLTDGTKWKKNLFCCSSVKLKNRHGWIIEPASEQLRQAFGGKGPCPSGCGHQNHGANQGIYPILPGPALYCYTLSNLSLVYFRWILAGWPIVWPVWSVVWGHHELIRAKDFLSR